MVKMYLCVICLALRAAALQGGLGGLRSRLCLRERATLALERGLGRTQGRALCLSRAPLQRRQPRGLLLLGAELLQLLMQLRQLLLQADTVRKSAPPAAQSARYARTF